MITPRIAHMLNTCDADVLHVTIEQVDKLDAHGGSSSATPFQHGLPNGCEPLFMSCLL